MPTITLTFPFPLNVSVQVGDIAYYCDTVNLGGHETGITSIISAPNFSPTASGARGVGNSIDPTIGSDIIQIGEILNIAPWNNITSSIDCDWTPIPSTANIPTVNSFIMFSKDNKANLSTILGYYTDIQFRNDSKSEAEIFSVGSNIFESSK
tara:strand:- start:87 stop:542 length:456 start_codon:yes stop_codon:yes gene_type:complete